MEEVQQPYPLRPQKLFPSPPDSPHTVADSDASTMALGSSEPFLAHMSQVALN